eukprot:m.233025 g.233025  ORF g.233025 m.233025 type:complete len:55 (+) comp22453_c0_seq1:391-555(+)
MFSDGVWRKEGKKRGFVLCKKHCWVMCGEEIYHNQGNKAVTAFCFARLVLLAQI